MAQFHHCRIGTGWEVAAEFMTGISAISVELVRNAVVVAAEEMSSTLVRTAHNPLLYDVQDFGVGIMSPEGESWADAPGMTVFVGVLTRTVMAGVEKFGLDGIRDGDIFIANDPYSTGNHISDVSIYAPVFVDRHLLAFVAITAHWADIGGKIPGGWCPDSVDVYQEGICFAHEKLFDAGKPNEALFGIIRCNTRYPDMVLGDLNAQIAACRQGIERMCAIAAKFGCDGLSAAMRKVIDRTDAFTRRRIAELPDGLHTVSMKLDRDGVTDEPFSVQLALAVEGDTIRVSFDGTSPSRPGPVNCPEYAVHSVIRAAVKGVLSPQEPANEGDFKAIVFDIEPGLCISPQRPAPVDSYGYLSNVCWELTMRALARILPERAVAGGGQLCMPTISRVDPRFGTPFVVADPLDVGNGARMASDGPTMAIPVMGDVPNMPVELAEMRYPIRIERFALRTDAIGHGRQLGGSGVRRDYRLLEPGIMVHTAFENVDDPMGRGEEGGTDGAPPQVVINPGMPDEVTMRQRAALGPFEVGDVISMQSGGGGGWGKPGERSRNAVARDVRNGILTPECAARLYGYTGETE
ncbi:MAG: hydantoinase B/oxoprolinase family protein [Sphingomonadales bacterium]|nr:MAG: hydantoinase B/oxoprolinase family protein [Sphingomonadales bacterium]TNF06391.1 MAG: hydantoinase B/oxoprolinase family protein [Sphingomonadales bacterium]